MKLKNIAVLLGLVFWPLSLFINNTLGDFLKYIIPIIEPKLILLPLIYFAFRKNIKLFLVFLFIFIIIFNRFWGQTIFKTDYEAQQEVIRQTLLYPNPLSARIFHNKVRIYIDKFNNNFFALTDPNNYFFRFAPRQITVDNQNLKKFPSLAIFSMLVGFYYLNKAKYKNQIVTFLIASILSLCVLTVFDRNDFILWFPLSAIFIYGAKFINSKAFWVVFIALSSLELLQILYA